MSRGARRDADARSRAHWGADHPSRVMRFRPPRGERGGQVDRFEEAMGVAEGKPANILVVRGGDIGITNLSCDARHDARR